MKTKKYPIWSDDLGELEDWREAFEDGEDLSDDELYYRATELNFEFLNDERTRLRDIDLEQPAVIIADLDLWDGHRSAYRCPLASTVGDLLYRSARSTKTDEWYINELGDLCCEEGHHDGVNHYLYRMWKPGTSDRQRMNLLTKIYLGTATRKDITRVTTRIGDKIAAYYGWTI